jgi:hypothetical protein
LIQLTPRAILAREEFAMQVKDASVVAQMASLT